MRWEFLLWSAASVILRHTFRAVCYPSILPSCLVCHSISPRRMKMSDIFSDYRVEREKHHSHGKKGTRHHICEWIHYVSYTEFVISLDTYFRWEICARPNVDIFMQCNHSAAAVQFLVAANYKNNLPSKIGIQRDDEPCKMCCLTLLPQDSTVVDLVLLNSYHTHSHRNLVSRSIYHSRDRNRTFPQREHPHCQGIIPPLHLTANLSEILVASTKFYEIRPTW